MNEWITYDDLPTLKSNFQSIEKQETKINICTQ